MLKCATYFCPLSVLRYLLSTVVVPTRASSALLHCCPQETQPTSCSHQRILSALCILLKQSPIVQYTAPEVELLESLVSIQLAILYATNGLLQHLSKINKDAHSSISSLIHTRWTHHPDPPSTPSHPHTTKKVTRPQTMALK
jgi:hypothetical protein